MPCLRRWKPSATWFCPSVSSPSRASSTLKPDGLFRPHTSWTALVLGNPFMTFKTKVKLLGMTTASFVLWPVSSFSDLATSFLSGISVLSQASSPLILVLPRPTRPFLFSLIYFKARSTRVSLDRYQVKLPPPPTSAFPWCLSLWALPSPFLVCFPPETWSIFGVH